MSIKDVGQWIRPCFWGQAGGVGVTVWAQSPWSGTSPGATSRWLCDLSGLLNIAHFGFFRYEIEVMSVTNDHRLGHLKQRGHFLLLGRSTKSRFRQSRASLETLEENPSCVRRLQASSVCGCRIRPLPLSLCGLCVCVFPSIRTLVIGIGVCGDHPE